ncbi:transcriptional regulator with XRE-family HTH domain [Psychromicrobium silvestre]|uniref:Transcriptional regulator with XRE-family HTH domain n=1 Tax=Psychromicrobium silvestre TaxID=1645614 RepID=A0A7Y9S5H5_9MICC|nr:helix-turn-helix transcriptional regulator [Psychromicrobium silvestre]NYE94923.1 transcriptional regulator with XRE-family HTH domain [Psychromicrobium silvestre]
MSSNSRLELGQFLRDRRNRLRPFDVGLPSFGRRRTPGLRREEVAQLAGVGVTWYTWLEQGRDINASAQVLNAVATALHLDSSEHRHLLTLAGVDARVVVPECEDVNEYHLTVMQKMLPYPCAIQNGRYDLLAWNRVYRFLIGDVEEHADGQPHNCLSMIFNDPAWKTAYGERYQEVCHSMVARFRANMASHLDEADWIDLVNQLKADSAYFTEVWEAQQVQRSTSYAKIFNSPRVGALRLQFTTLWLDQQRDTRLMTVTPLDELSANRLAKLDAMVDSEPAVSRRNVSPAA